MPSAWLTRPISTTSCTTFNTAEISLNTLRVTSGSYPGGRISAKTQVYPRTTRSVWLPDCKPVPVPLRAAVIHLDRPLLAGSSDLPGSQAGRAVPPPLFGLAPRGVFPAGRITPAAVRSYRTISPLPHLSARRYIFCGTFRRILRSPRPLAGTLPCGDRTFLPRFRERPPVRQPYLIIVARFRLLLYWETPRVGN